MAQSLERLRSAVRLIPLFGAVAALMAGYEALKELYFQGTLSLWESHTITVFVTATLATLAGAVVRRRTRTLAIEAIESHETATSILEQISDAIVVIDERGVVHRFNPAAERIFGFAASEVIGRNASMLMPESDAGSRARHRTRYLMRRSSKIFGAGRREVRGLRADGSVFHMELVASEMTVGGRRMFVSVVRDIHEIKSAQQELDRLRRAEKQAFEMLQGELVTASTIQMNMIPKGNRLFQDVPHVRAFGAVRPAREMSGDFYDAFGVGDRHVCFAIGDVSGKGVAAALFMMETMALLRSKITKPKKFDTALPTVNRLLTQRNDTNMFVSLFVGLLNVETGELRFVNGGHNPPLLSVQGAPFETMAVPSDIILGVHEDAKYQIGSTGLGAGDVVVLYTDGVTEAENERGEPFSLERARASLASTRLDPKSLVYTLVEDVAEFAGDRSQSDDIAVLALQFQPDLADAREAPFFEWSESLRVGIDEIDDQHQTLVDIVNRLHEEMILKEADREAIDEIVHELVQYSRMHFELEERLFAELDPGEAERHARYHEELKGRLSEMLARRAGHQDPIDVDLLRFVRKWLEHHIATEDRRAFGRIGEPIHRHEVVTRPE